MSGREQGRLGDRSQVPADAHGCPACPHPAIGPAIAGSANVNVNGRPALRVDDPGIHTACCGPNTWTATTGSATVFINGKHAHRRGDQVRHCGGVGQLVEGSPNVYVGDARGTSSPPPPEHWIHHRFVGEQDGQPVAGLPWRLRAPSGEIVASGTTGPDGLVSAQVDQPGAFHIEHGPEEAADPAEADAAPGDHEEDHAP